jgi:hypothetical protein
MYDSPHHAVHYHILCDWVGGGGVISYPDPALGWLQSKENKFLF